MPAYLAKKDRAWSDRVILIEAPVPRKNMVGCVVTRPGDKTNCLFCGTSFRAGKKGEDVSSDWYAREIGVPDGHVTVMLVDFNGEVVEQSRATQTPAAKEFRLVDVCPDSCNGDWMSQIENDAKPVLLRLMQGQSATLDVEEQKKIAVWGQLKAICWDALQAGDAALPPTIYGQFRTHRPLHWAVTIARVESHSRSDITFTRNVGLMSIVGPGDTAPVVFRATIIFDQLMIQVSTVLDANLPPPELLRDMTPEGVLGIWPLPIASADTDISWPPSKQFSKKETAQLF